jgi:GNAT superfamily N-acetyltransferase
MKSSEFQVIPPDRLRHLDEMSDLMAKVFSDVGYFEFRNQCRRWYVNHSHYDWRVSRIGILDGRIITHYGVWGYDMRIGSAVVRAGGIGGVATHGDFRRRGFMARTVRASLDAMRGNGYDITILFGINDFYHGFGYVLFPNEHPQLRVWDRY